MSLKYTVKAKGQLRRLPGYVQTQILAAIREIKTDPSSGDLLKRSRTLRRTRVSVYRIVYQHSGSTIKIIFIELRSAHIYHRVNPKRLPSPHIKN